MADPSSASARGIKARTPDIDVVTATNQPALLSRVSWGAIFAGTFIALGVLALLGMMGSAIGLNAIEPAGSGMDGVGIGAAIWWIVTSVIALGIGGYVAGHLSGIPEKRSATAHGATVWGLVTVITLWLAAGMVGSLVNTATGALAGTVRAAGAVAGDAGQAAATAGVDIPEDQIRRRAEQVLDQARQEVRQIDRSEVAAGSERALDAVSSAAWYAFFASLLSLLAAVLAAGWGAPRFPFMTSRETIHT